MEWAVVKPRARAVTYATALRIPLPPKNGATVSRNPQVTRGAPPDSPERPSHLMIGPVSEVEVGEHLVTNTSARYPKAESGRRRRGS